MRTYIADQGHTGRPGATSGNDAALAPARFNDRRPRAAAQEQRAMIDSSPRLAQVQALAASVQQSPRMVAQRRGLPEQLKAGVESLSGMSMDHVSVHYNSAQPARLNALAYAQGSDIHLGPGQEQHLPHEAWHVVQQAQGRVQPTAQMKEGVPVNDDAGLEQEADVMGAKAAQLRIEPDGKVAPPPQRSAGTAQLLAGLSPGTYVEVRAPGGTWYGYIERVAGPQYEVVVGGTSAKGYGYEDADAVKQMVPAAQVFLHPSIKSGLGVPDDDDRELQPDALAVLKGRGYKRQTKASVEQGWNNISDEERTDQDDKFRVHYKPNLELGEPKTFLQDQNRMLRNQMSVDDNWAQHRAVWRQYGIETVEALRECKARVPVPANDDAIYDKTESFKVGWHGSAVENARRRAAGQPHGEYTGSYNLTAGWLKAEGSYRQDDDLQQNEIIYQIWKAAHVNEGLDMAVPGQRKQLRQITRNHVVNTASQPILEPLKGGTYRPGSKEFDMLLSTPNIRAALFLVKDRGRELGITGIRSIYLPGVDAIIDFTVA
jgi:hypothetical protein